MNGVANAISTHSLGSIVVSMIEFCLHLALAVRPILTAFSNRIDAVAAHFNGSPKATNGGRQACVSTASGLRHGAHSCWDNAAVARP